MTGTTLCGGRLESAKDSKVTTHILSEVFSPCFLHAIFFPLLSNKLYHPENKNKQNQTKLEHNIFFQLLNNATDTYYVCSHCKNLLLLPSD